MPTVYRQNKQSVQTPLFAAKTHKLARSLDPGHPSVHLCEQIT